MEVDFPRGRGEKQSHKNVEKSRKPLKRKREKNLFMTEKTKPKIKKRKIIKPDENNKKKRQIEGSVDFHSATKIEQFNVKSVCPGFVLLGCICEIRDYKLIISLANNMKGVVAITDVSDAYTDKLQQLADGQIQEDEDVHSLSEMFKVGMLVCCKVSENQLKINKKILDLTINPKVVYENKTAKFLKNKTLMCGSVVSREDHGYIIDIGITNTTGFLPTKYAEDYMNKINDGEPLMIGQIIWCRVNVKDGQDLSSDSKHTVHLNIVPKTISNTVIDVDTPLSYNNLMPGVHVMAIVKKSSEHGLVVRTGNKICVIHPTHINGDPASYKEEQEIPVKVLYIHADTKSVYLTMLPHLLNYDGTVVDSQFDEFTLGDVIENAVVCEANKKGAYLKLTHGVTGLAQKGNLSDSQVKTVEEEFPIGSKHKCRVVGFCFVDNFVLLSLKKTILERDFIRIRDIVPGSVFKVEVKYVKDTVLGVRISDLKGIIPALHMADIPLKNPGKKFSEGDELECRVLSVDIKENKVVFTNKKSLVNTKLPVVHDPSQIRKSMELEGFIAMINDQGVLVVFYNNVKGWVPRSELSEERIEDPEKVFYLGQVVRCRVKNYNDETHKIVLSLRKEDRTREPRTRNISVSEDFVAGKIIQCKIKIKLKYFYIVEDISTKHEAILYKSHLADFDDLSDALWEKLQEGDLLERVMHFACRNKIIVSMKPSLLQQVESDIIPKDFSEMSNNMILPAVIKNIVEYGIFFTLTGGLGGLIPMKVASDDYLSYEEIINYFHVDQSIVVRITYLDMEKKTFVGSLLTRHCFPRSNEKASLLMRLYLENKNMVSMVLGASISTTDFMSKIKPIPVGSVVTAMVTDINDDGVVCQMSNGLQAHVSNEMLCESKAVEGEKLLGVVSSIDIAKERIDLFLDKYFISAMKNSETENQMRQLNVDENIPALVIQVNPTYYLVSLREKALGSMAYVPTKDTINSINELDLYPVKHKLNVKIHSVYDENLIALVNNSKPQPVKLPVKRSQYSLSVGGVFTAKVVKIHPTTMKLQIEGHDGVIHCTDVLDEIENGVHPFSKYKEGSDILVRINGYTKRKGQEEKIAECTARPSQLKGKKEKISRSFPLKSYRRVFINKINKETVDVNISSKRIGSISIFDLSNDLTVLQNIQKHFKKGQGYNAEVVGCKGRTRIMFSLTSGREKTVVGGITKCYVIDVNKESREITLSLPFRYKAVVKVDKNIEKYKKGKWFVCEVLTMSSEDSSCIVKFIKSK